MIYPEFVLNAIDLLPIINDRKIIVFTTDRLRKEVDAGLEKNKNIVKSRVIIVPKEEPSNLNMISTDLDFSPDCIYAIGGGSCFDFAKSTLAFEINELRVESFGKTGLYQSSIDALPPIVFFSTVTGSGAEISSSSVLNVEERKRYIVSESFLPSRVVYSLSHISRLPRKLKLAGLGDSVAHLIESSFSRRSGEFSVAQKKILLSELFNKMQAGSDITADPRFLSLMSFWGGVFQDRELVGPVHVIAHSNSTRRHANAVTTIMPKVYTTSLLQSLKDITDHELTEVISRVMCHWDNCFSAVYEDSLDMKFNATDTAGLFSYATKLYEDVSKK